MKVLYLISVMKKGYGGGHAISLDHIINELNKLNNLKLGIISIGINESKINSKNPAYLQHIFFDGKNLITFYKNINSAVKNFNPDIIHAFDQTSYNISKLFLFRKKIKFILNKCGGPNPSTYPKIENLILFSKENYNWFKYNEKYANSNIQLIPNRVSKIIPDLNFLKEVPRNNSAFNFMRIARIGSAYERSFMVSIDLIRNLNLRGFKDVHLYIVGIIENQNIYKKLKEYASGLNVSFFTEDKFTVNASKMLFIADAIIATGRGFMEAASIGKPVLTPASNSNFPVLVTKENFEGFFSTNFSERNFYDGTNEKNIDHIVSLLPKDKLYRIYSQFSEELFNDNFDIQIGAKLYLKEYNDLLKKQRHNSVPVYSDIIFKMKSIYGFYKSSKLLKKGF